MTDVDRRAHDPFAPHLPAAAPAPEPTVQPVPKGIDDMRKDDLIALAEQRGLDTTGTRGDLIARIRAAAA